MGKELIIPGTIFERTQQWVSSSPHTNLWNVFHFTQPITHNEQVFEEWEAERPEKALGLWSVFIGPV